MKRNLPLFVMVGVAGVLVPVLVVLAQPSSPRSAACCPSASSTTSKSSAPSSTDDKIIDEMIAILKETKSEETFIVTAMALGRMGPEAKRALPQLIRNAERLELFEDLFDSNASNDEREVARQVAEAIMMLAESNKDGRPGVYGYYAFPPPVVYDGYGASTATAPTWNQPQAASTPSAVPTCPAGSANCPITASPPPPTTGTTPAGVLTPTPPSPPRSSSVNKASPRKGKAPAPIPPAPSPSSY
jgi:hypothetical protein